MVDYKNIKVTPLTHGQFLRVQREMAAAENARITQDDVINRFITIFRNTHSESKKKSKKENKQ